MQNFNIIRSIVLDISTAEKKLLWRIIDGQSKRADVLRKLYELIIDKGLDDPIRVKDKIYGKDDKLTTDAFRKACDRFLEVLFESVSHIDMYDANRHLYSEVFYYRKMVVHWQNVFYSLRIKKIPSDVRIKMMQPIVMICEKYEFLEELLSLKMDLLGQYVNVNNRNEWEKCLVDLVKISKHLVNQKQADVYLYRYINLVQHHAVDDKSRINELGNAVKEVEISLLESPLKTIEFNYLMLKLQYMHFVENFDEAERVVYNLIELTNQNPCVKYFYRISQNYMNLSYTQLFLGKYHEAYENSLRASQETFNQMDSINLHRESCVFPLIYLNKIEEADKLLIDILSSGLVGNGVEEMSKRKLMHAFVKYLLGDYKAAFNLLQDTKESESDKEGWNLGVRMLNIYLTLTTDKVDLADQRIGSMRKHIERTSKLRNLRKRDVIIFRILSHLSRSGFDFKETWEDRQKDFDLLRNGGGDYRWIPRSHELIIFDQWFEAKMLGKPYQPVFPKPAATASA